jgi:16S rRNA (adenine1518-N6/adenine1519-N6)-dimethyltransferase
MVNQNTKKQGFRPDKRLGQHFINDRGIIDHIIQCAAFSPTDSVLEIGPGQGALTIPLAGYVARIIAVEKDKRLIGYLEDRITKAGITNVSVTHDDILKMDLSDCISSEKKIKVIGNLPYNISSPLLEKLLNHKEVISEAILMFQYEFAERLTAKPGCKQYGSLTVMTEYNSSVTPLVRVSKDVFFPRPKVGSTVVKIDLEKPHPRRAKDEGILELIVRGSFSSRRKTIINSLKVVYKEFGRDELIGALNQCNIDQGRRAETLSIDDFICLADALTHYTSYERYCNRPPG